MSNKGSFIHFVFYFYLCLRKLEVNEWTRGGLTMRIATDEKWLVVAGVIVLIGMFATAFVV